MTMQQESCQEIILPIITKKAVKYI